MPNKKFFIFTKSKNKFLVKEYKGDLDSDSFVCYMTIAEATKEITLLNRRLKKELKNEKRN